MITTPCPGTIAEYPPSRTPRSILDHRPKNNNKDNAAPIAAARPGRGGGVDADLEPSRVQPVGQRLDAAGELGLVGHDAALGVARGGRRATSAVGAVLGAGLPPFVDLERVPTHGREAGGNERGRRLLDKRLVHIEPTQVPTGPGL